MSQHIILRRTEERQAQMDELAQRTGKSGDTAVLDFALQFTLAQTRSTPQPHPATAPETQPQEAT